MDSLVVWRGGEGAEQEGAIVFYGILLIRAYDFLGFLSVFLCFRLTLLLHITTKLLALIPFQKSLI